MSEISNNIWKILSCCYCGNKLVNTNNGAKCEDCGDLYKYTDSGIIDLRPLKPKIYELKFKIGGTPISSESYNIEPLIPNPSSELSFRGSQVPRHLTNEILSYFPKAKSTDSLMLDLGCGSAIHKELCENAGFSWVGLDYSSQKALFLGDAHSLPFQNESFEFILSMAMLEHIRYPFVMMQEAFRVLKYGGKFIGTVAFLEPFHGESYYHHSHLGIINSLQYGGFVIEKIAPNKGWAVLNAQAGMGLFPHMPKPISRTIIFPMTMLHKMWWKIGNLFSEQFCNNFRLRDTSGAFTFIATKSVRDNRIGGN